MVYMRKYANVANVGRVVVEGREGSGVYRWHFCGCEDGRHREDWYWICGSLYDDRRGAELNARCECACIVLQAVARAPNAAGFVPLSRWWAMGCSRAT